MLQAGQAPNLRAGALTLAEAGVTLFPCAPGGKQPLTSRGFHDASNHPGQVAQWWRQWPDANIGLPTGAVNGVVVVDVDVHPGGSGYGAFGRAHTAGFTEGWAWQVRTPSGGLHAFYPYDPGAKDGQRSWQVAGAHVDFRGDGGYVIAAPSCVAVEGALRAYELVAVTQTQPRPIDSTGLRAFLDPPRLLRPPASAPARGTRPDRLAAWVASRPEGSRNHGLFWAACRLAEDGHRVDSAMSTLGDAAVSAGLSEREAVATIRSAYRIATRLAPDGAADTRPTRAVEAVRL